MSSKTKTTATKEDGKTALVPKLRFPKFQDAGEWRATNLGKHIQLQSGFAFSSEYFGSEGKKLVTPKNFTKFGFGNFDDTVSKYTTELVPQKYICNPGDLLVLLTDLTPTCELLGKPLEVAEKDGDVLLNQRVAKVAPVSKGVTTSFLKQFFLTETYNEVIVKTASGSTVKHSSNKVILNMGVVFPLPEEQQKIAECLSSVDELITAQARKLDALKTHKNGLMQQLFPREGETRPRLRFPEFQDAGDWMSKPLGAFGGIVTGKTPSTKESDLWGGDILFITPTDISDDDKYQHTTARTVVETKSTKILPAGSVVYTCIASIGKMALTVHPSITNQQINAVVPNEKILGEFIYYALANLTPWIKTIPATTTLPIINKTDFSKIAILLPEDKAEQQRIASCLTGLDDIIAAQTAKLDALKTHKKGLMQQLFPSPEKVEA